MLLDQLLNNLAVNVEPFATCEVKSGANLPVEPLDWVTIHFVLHGEGTLSTPAQELLVLRPRTLVLLPPGTPHSLTANRQSLGIDSRPVDVKGTRRYVSGNGPGDLIIACGRLQASYARGLDLFGLLDRPIVLDFSDSKEMLVTFQQLLEESRSGSPGALAMMTALMNQCLVLVFRELCDSTDCHLPWLDALDDPQMAAVLKAILDHPENHHSLESLAHIAAMSRSTFAEEFTKRFGRTPMTFLREVRLRRAAELLQTPTQTVTAVARQVGFASRSHFSRAFHHYFGSPPSEFRATPHRS